MWSALIIAGISLAATLVKSGIDKNTADKMVQEQMQMNAEQKAEYARATAEVSEMYQPEMEIGAQGLNELGSFDDSALYNRDEYQYDKTVDDFMNPYQDYAREQAMKDISHSASATGGVGSGATFEALQDRSMDLSNQYYDTAYGQKTADDSTQYSRYIDKFNQDKLLLDSQYQQIQDKINLGTMGKNQVQSAITNQASGNISLLGEQGDLSAMLAQSSGQAANNVVGAIGSAAGGVTGALTQAPTTTMATTNNGALAPNTVYNPTTGGYTSTVSSGNLAYDPSYQATFGNATTDSSLSTSGYNSNLGPDIRSIYGGQ